MLKLKWQIYKDYDEFRFDRSLSDINFGVYTIWSNSGENITPLYTGQGNIKQRLYYHNSQTDFGDHFPLSVAWADTFDMNGIERFLYNTLNPKITKSSPRVTPIPVNLPTYLN